MRLKNVLIVTKDIEKARQFYHDLFGLELVLGLSLADHLLILFIS